MSRKRKAPVRKVYPDPKFHSEVVSKFINSIMYDGKRSTAEKILYDALEKIKSKNKVKPIFAFGFIKFCSSNNASVSVSVVKNIISAVSEIIRAILALCPEFLA